MRPGQRLKTVNERRPQVESGCKNVSFIVTSLVVPGTFVTCPDSTPEEIPRERESSAC